MGDITLHSGCRRTAVAFAIAFMLLDGVTLAYDDGWSAEAWSVGSSTQRTDFRAGLFKRNSTTLQWEEVTSSTWVTIPYVSSELVWNYYYEHYYYVFWEEVFEPNTRYEIRIQHLNPIDGFWYAYGSHQFDS